MNNEIIKKIEAEQLKSDIAEIPFVYLLRSKRVTVSVSRYSKVPY